MEDKDIELILLYVESTYEAIDKPLPKKDNGQIDIIKARAYLVQLEHQNIIVGFDEWCQKMGQENNNIPEWPVDMPWPPWRKPEYYGMTHGS